jgi:hypothetical protein
MGEAQRGKPRGAPQRHWMVRSMAQTTFTTAYILCGVMDVSLMTLPTDGLQRILEQRRFRGGEMTPLTRGFDRTRVTDVDAVRHDQVALDGPGKRRWGMLAVAEEALLGGLARMLTCRENLSMATQTLAWRDLGQEVCAALMFPMTGGARLLTNSMVLPQQHRPMTVNTPLEGYAGPRPMATGAIRLQRRMCRRQRSVHEDSVVTGKPDPRQQGEHNDGTAKDRKGCGANGTHLSVRHYMAGHVRLYRCRDGDRGCPA